MNFTALENDYFHNCSFDYRLVIIIMVIIVHPRVFTPPLPLPFSHTCKSLAYYFNVLVFLDTDIDFYFEIIIQGLHRAPWKSSAKLLN